MRICLIVNPTAGQSKPGAALPKILNCLSVWCPDVVVRETDCRGAGERLAREIEPGEFDLVVAVGGDGTINEVLNGLGPHTPMGIIPLGTANVLARELNIPANDLADACAVLKECRPRPMDLGECNGRRFSLMAGIGFDAEAVKDVPPSVKDLIGGPAYIISGLHALTQLRRPIRYRLYLPERRVVARGMMLVAANASSYAGQLQIAPCASMEDGTLDLCLFRERSRLAFLGQWFNVVTGRHLKDPHFEYFHTQRVRVECDPPAAVQLDGDYFGRTPVEIQALPGIVNVIRPE